MFQRSFFVDVRNFFKNFLGILLILSGIAAIVMIFLLTKSRHESVAVSDGLTIAANVIIAVYALINIICGFVFLARRIPRKAIKVRPFVQVSAVLGLVQIIISASNGILIPHLFIMLGIAVVVPEIFFVAIGPILRK